ncbi:MAG: hypothetical protein U0325_23460 [Polyangiales bacterium]
MALPQARSHGPREEGFSGLRLRVEPVDPRTMQELADRCSPLWMIFAPRALDPTEGALREERHALRARTDERCFGALAVTMANSADADTRAWAARTHRGIPAQGRSR